MEHSTTRQENAIANINRVGISKQDMLDVADATSTYITLHPDAFGRSINRCVIEEMFGEGSAKSLAIEARMMALRQMVRRGKAPAWLAPKAVQNPAIGKALLEAAALEAVQFDGVNFCFDANDLCNRMLMLTPAGMAV